MNRAILIGRLGQDPQLRYTQSGKAVCGVSLAVDRGGDRGADWIDVVCWGKLAETFAEYCAKGRLVAVEGRLQVRSWEDKQGQRRRTVEVVAEAVHFLGPRGEGDSAQPSKPNGSAQDREEVPF